jgi:uncharacterized membrane protein YphA (DoxX/SURF4 family)
VSRRRRSRGTSGPGAGLRGVKSDTSPPDAGGSRTAAATARAAAVAVAAPRTELGWAWAVEWMFGPQPIERLILLRIVVPLAVLGFLSSRLIHADEWLSPTGFHVPDLGGGDWRQPLFLPAIPAWAAWAIAVTTAVAGICVVVGFRPRAAAVAFAALVAYLVLADRLEAFTVSKLAPVLSLALAASPCGARFGVDAWLQRRASVSAPPPPEHVTGGTVRFFQVFLAVMYSGSGIAKARGDWFSGDVLWSHLHDNYQTALGWHVMNALPAGAWRILQDVTLTFELGAPLWFVLPWTRTPALVVGLGMHTMIGLMFGPVIWFALLMAGMLIACYAPTTRLRRAWGAGDR